MFDARRRILTVFSCASLAALLVACAGSTEGAGFESSGEGEAVGEDVAALPVKPLDPGEDPTPRGPKGPKPPACYGDRKCSLEPSVFFMKSPFFRMLKEIGCATPAEYTSPSLSRAFVARCPDSARLRDAAAEVNKPPHFLATVTTNACGTCLPALRKGRVYVFYWDDVAHPNCPNNCAETAEEQYGSTWETEAP